MTTSARVGANLATLANAALGVGGILYVLAGNKLWAMLLFLGAIGFDGLDGILSRRAGAGPSRFGRFADSGADAITFGLGPAFLLAVHTANSGLWAPWRLPSLAVAILVALLAFTRLALYTTRTFQLTYFRGASTPQTTLAIVLLVLLFDVPGYLGSDPLALLAGSVGLGLLMISPIPYPKMRRGEPFRWPMTATALLAAIALIPIQFQPAAHTGAYLLAEIATGGLALGTVGYYVGGPLTVRRAPAATP